MGSNSKSLGKLFDIKKFPNFFKCEFHYNLFY